MRHLKVSLLLVERKRCAGEFLLISVSSSNALSLLQSPGAGDDIRFMDDASSNPGKISSCVSAVVYRVSLCAVFISTWLTVIVLLTQATSLDKCSSNFGRRSVCVCVFVCAHMHCFCSLLVSWAKTYHLQEVQMSRGFLCAFILQPVFRASRLLD